MLKTSGLSHIHLLVRDLGRSIHFYSEVFGLEEQFREEPDLVFLRTPGTRDLITLHESDHARAGESGGIMHFGFTVDDASEIDAATTLVEQAGGEVVRKANHSTGHPSIYVSDPDGYVIEIGV